MLTILFRPSAFGCMVLINWRVIPSVCSYFACIVAFYQWRNKTNHSFQLYMWMDFIVAVGSMCRQGSCNRANGKSNDKSFEATSTDTTTSHFGFNLVVVAAPAAACIAVHSLLVTSWLAEEERESCCSRGHCIVWSVCVFLIFVIPFFAIMCSHHSFLHDALQQSCVGVWSVCECHCDWNEKRCFVECVYCNCYL